MLLDDKAKHLQFLCGLLFLLGIAVGCVIGFQSTENALHSFSERILQWYTTSGPIRCFAGDICICFFCLISSISVLGCVFVPVVGFCYGGFLSLALFSLLCTITAWQAIGLCILAVLVSTVILRVFVLCATISIRCFRLWYTSGMQSFDLQPFIRSLWISLLLLFLILIIRCICKYFALL